MIWEQFVNRRQPKTPADLIENENIANYKERRNYGQIVNRVVRLWPGLRIGLGMPGQVFASTGCPLWVAERDRTLCEEINKAGQSPKSYDYLVTEKPFRTLG